MQGAGCCVVCIIQWSRVLVEWRRVQVQVPVPREPDTATLAAEEKRKLEKTCFAWPPPGAAGSCAVWDGRSCARRVCASSNFTRHKTHTARDIKIDQIFFPQPLNRSKLHWLSWLPLVLLYSFVYT